MGIKFKETALKGAFVIEPERFDDERGFFARSFSAKEFAKQGINTQLVECNISYNLKKGTIRGMHFQAAPHAQAKLVRCTAGAILDVIIDLRPASPTLGQWVGVELTAQNRKMLYVPEGFAHGFQTLVDETEVFYEVSDYYAPESCGGVRWDDNAFRIDWREKQNVTINERDRSYPDFKF